MNMDSENKPGVTAIGGSPNTFDSGRKEQSTASQATDLSLPEAIVSKITRNSRNLGVVVSGIALFSDGYNAQIIGYMEPLFSEL